MKPIYVDQLPVFSQNLLALAPRLLPYPACRTLLLSLTRPSLRESYLTAMRLEVLWLGQRYLKKNFVHQGVDQIDPEETYVITSLHYGQWGMYPASLYQQTGISSQMIISGRNRKPNSRPSHFWHQFGHLKQGLSGHPGRYSTDRFFQHVSQLKQGINQVTILDVREQGLQQKELATDFMGEPFYLPATVPLLARRAQVRILPYLGYYDSATGQHRVQWFAPVSPAPDNAKTLQALVDLFQPTFARHPEFYFNDLAWMRTPFQG
ncbi:MAG: hypothetical protein RQ715_07135 [Methylococcales bacterium]|nr:hypothetical protein [Methylococcales bacterium]